MCEEGLDHLNTMAGSSRRTLNNATIAEPAQMTITVNGESRALASNMSVCGLLEALGLDMRKVAVERNMEIVHFIGGG